MAGVLAPAQGTENWKVEQPMHVQDGTEGCYTGNDSQSDHSAATESKTIPLPPECCARGLCRCLPATSLSERPAFQLQPL